MTATAFHYHDLFTRTGNWANDSQLQTEYQWLARTYYPYNDFDERYLNRILDAGEELLWWERPPAGWTRPGNDKLVALMAVPLLLVPMSLLVSALQTKDPTREGVGALSDSALNIIGAVGALFVASGIYLLANHFSRDSSKKKDTLYAITSRRAIRITFINRFQTTVSSAPLAWISAIQVTRNENHRGTIRMQATVTDWTSGRPDKVGNEWKYHHGPFFVQITSPERVRDLLVRAKIGNLAPASFPSSQSIRRGWWYELLPIERRRWTGHSPNYWWIDRAADTVVTKLANRGSRWQLTSRLSDRLDSLLCNRPMRREPRIEYMVTDRRVVLFGPRFSDFVRSIPLDSIDRLWVQPGPNGLGTIFARSDVMDWPYRDGRGAPMAGPLFEEIPSAEHLVAAMLPSTQVTDSGMETRPGGNSKWLEDGESLIWSGVPTGDQPIPGRFAAVVAALIVYGVIVTLWLWYVFKQQAPEPGGAGLFIGAVLLAIAICGLWVTYLRFRFNLHLQDGTVYGITDRRAILQTRRWVEFTPLDAECVASIKNLQSWQQAESCHAGETQRFRFD